MPNDLVPYAEKRALAAAKYVEAVKPPPMGDLLRVKGGVFMLGEDELGDELCVVVLGHIYTSTYFKDDYDPDNSVPPTCYAYGLPGDVMAPHPSMAAHPDHFEPQHHQCEGCPMNEWGSADKGDGKACKQKVKLALIQGGMYTPRPKSKDKDLDMVDATTREGQQHFQDADSLAISVSVTSTKNFDKYVQKLVGLGQPVFGVYTRMYLEPHKKWQHEMKFEMLEVIPDAAFDILQGRHDSLGDMATPYSPPDEERNERKKGVKGLQRR